MNTRANEIVVETRLGTLPAVRDAVDELSARGPAPAADPALTAAVAAANRGVLLRLLPARQASIDATYQTSLAAKPAHASTVVCTAANRPGWARRWVGASASWQ